MDDELIVTHSQEFGRAISLFRISKETAHKDLAVALCVYNGADLIECSDEKAVIRSGRGNIEIKFDGDVLKNMSKVISYFDNTFFKKTVYSEVSKLKKFNYKENV